MGVLSIILFREKCTALYYIEEQAYYLYVSLYKLCKWIITRECCSILMHTCTVLFSTDYMKIQYVSVNA